MPQQDRRKGRSCFFSGRMQGDEREDPGSGIQRHLPPEAVRTGEFGDTCLRTQPASGIRRMTECRKPVRMDRYEATGPSVRAGTGGPASARQLPGERSGGRGGGGGEPPPPARGGGGRVRGGRHPPGRFRGTGGGGVRSSAEAIRPAAAGVRRGICKCSRGRCNGRDGVAVCSQRPEYAIHGEGRQHLFPKRIPPLPKPSPQRRNAGGRGGVPGAACAGLLPESGDFAEQTFFDAVK